MKHKKTLIRKSKSAITLKQLKNVMGTVSREVNTNINSLRNEIGGLKGEIGGLRDEMHSEIGGLRDEMRCEIGGLKGEIGKIDDKISNLYAMMQQDFAKKEDLARLEMRVEALEIR